MSTVLVTVGSTLFDDLIHAFAPKGAVIKALKEAKFDKLLLQYGKGSSPVANISSGDLQVDVFRFSDDIDALIAKSDLVISHAGRKLIVVPNTSLMNNHQAELALALEHENYLYVSTPESLCFFGIRNLNKALATAKSNPSSLVARLNFDLELKPFVLDPTLTREPIDRRKKYEARHGKEGLAARQRMTQERAKECGVTFTYDGTVSSTHEYHRLLYAAYEKGGQGMQVPLAERLFSGYFENRKNPGSREYLASEAVTSGVFPIIEAANEFFESDEYDAEVKQGYLTARMMGVSGVPFFVFDGKVAVRGAQPPEAFLDIFTELLNPNGSGGDTADQDTTPGASKGGKAESMACG
ncbi:hypothetical protein QFC21_001844 [Naganishia friedmannii]|uniref:Uncharacterized protein n=1 Tax=Naganishia friedmannii TaxID=89922 RepID=A0ACC2W1B9_9TREE|nr:hypothetical protein QFC21_001844 [Naganishia friedmannii]